MLGSFHFFPLSLLYYYFFFPFPVRLKRAETNRRHCSLRAFKIWVGESHPARTGVCTGTLVQMWVAVSMAVVR